jgi:hypothetical protein
MRGSVGRTPMVPFSNWGHEPRDENTRRWGVPVLAEDGKPDVCYVRGEVPSLPRGGLKWRVRVDAVWRGTGCQWHLRVLAAIGAPLLRRSALERRR